MKILAASARLETQCSAMRRPNRAGSVSRRATIRSRFEHLDQTDAILFMYRAAQHAPRAEQADEAMHVRVLREPCPIEPTDLVVLAIGVVVAALRVPDFVPTIRSLARPMTSASR